MPTGWILTKNKNLSISAYDKKWDVGIWGFSYSDLQNPLRP
jgi:hypothetical protein